MQSTHTYAILDVSTAAYDEIREKLKIAGYEHAFHRQGTGKARQEDREVIDMHGIGLRQETAQRDEAQKREEIDMSTPTPNLTETEVGAAWYVDDNVFGMRTRRQECVVVVSGPDADDEMCVMAGAESYLSRATAEALALEILRRLGIRITDAIGPIELE